MDKVKQLRLVGLRDLGRWGSGLGMENLKNMMSYIVDRVDTANLYFEDELPAWACPEVERVVNKLRSSGPEYSTPTP